MALKSSSTEHSNTHGYAIKDSKVYKVYLVRRLRPGVSERPRQSD
jgi:hypothetical protein